MLFGCKSKGFSPNVINIPGDVSDLLDGMISEKWTSLTSVWSSFQLKRFHPLFFYFLFARRWRQHQTNAACEYMKISALVPFDFHSVVKKMYAMKRERYQILYNEKEESLWSSHWSCRIKCFLGRGLCNFTPLPPDTLQKKN